jgi:hypothetical protein
MNGCRGQRFMHVELWDLSRLSGPDGLVLPSKADPMLLLRAGDYPWAQYDSEVSHIPVPHRRRTHLFWRQPPPRAECCSGRPT